MKPLPADDPVRRQPDITLARQRSTGGRRSRCAKGLRKTIDWFRSIDIQHYRPPTPNY